MSDLILILVVVIPTVAVSVWWVLRPVKKIENPETATEILFKNGLIEHATETALALLPIAVGVHNWQDLHYILHPTFPEFPVKPHAPLSAITLISGNSSQARQIRIIWRADSTSLMFEEKLAAPRTSVDYTELDILRQVSSLSNHPSWKTNETGEVIWNNKAYRNLADSIPYDTLATKQPIFELPAIARELTTNRIKIEIADNVHPEWYDVVRIPVPNGTIHQATSLTALIKAEEAQREFVQTLAKTFAHLSIGLAIFNRNRQLALFNPALIDLTGLSVSFLSPRPTIDSFFDALRENRRMPEPKNYNTWRQRMADLVTAAETGRFEETWSLESGQTYSIKGRPHPDGAVAFLIEDISAEISLTRNFRAELEMGQGIADTFDDAFAVFLQSGILTFSNKAYDLLWGFQHESSFADVTIGDSIQLWKEKSAPNPLWQDLQDAVMSLETRDEWNMPVCLRGQRPMNCRIIPIGSGATIIRFSLQDAKDSAAPSYVGQ